MRYITEFSQCTYCTLYVHYNNFVQHDDKRQSLIELNDHSKATVSCFKTKIFLEPVEGKLNFREGARFFSPRIFYSIRPANGFTFRSPSRKYIQISPFLPTVLPTWDPFALSKLLDTSSFNTSIYPRAVSMPEITRIESKERRWRGEREHTSFVVIRFNLSNAL